MRNCQRIYNGLSYTSDHYNLDRTTTRKMTETSNMQRTEQICLFVLLMVTTISSECNRRRIIHTLSYEGCQPKRLLSYACEGACSSYSRPSANVAGELEHFCECCKQTESRMAQVVLRCPNSNGRSIRRIRVPVNIPLACACRPCSLLPANIIPAEHELQHGKRSTSYVFTHMNETQSVNEESKLNKIIKGNL